MNFSVDIPNLSRLIVTCDPGCEDAARFLVTSVQQPQQPQQPQAAAGPIVLARVTRDPATGRLRLRISCDCGGGRDSPVTSPHAPASPVSAIGNKLNSNGDPTEAEADADAEADAESSGDEAEANEAEEEDAELHHYQPHHQQTQTASSDASANEAAPVQSSYASALEEFVATERSYVRRLTLLFDHYYPGLAAAVQSRQLGCCGGGPDELKRVFGHFQAMQRVHGQLLADLMESETLGKLMSQYAHQLKSYGTYYSMFPQITATVRGWMTDEAFRRVFAQLRQECAAPAESQLDLRALLLEPVQRPMRYPMLLAKYLAEIGESHPDWRDARRAADIVQDVLHELEKSLRDFAAFQERLQLLRSVSFPAALSGHWEEFAHSCLRHGRARQGSKQRFLMLSKTTLLVCSPSRFRQEAWIAKRAVPLPGDLRVLSCEGSLLRMDTAGDLLLLLTFGGAVDVAADSAEEGVRQCRDWAMELRRLGVPFVDTPADQDDRLMPWERAAGRCGRPVMTPLDKATRCEACASALGRLQRRRLSCRVCGGAFCSDCAVYQASTSWGGDRPLRCCLFCRVATGGAGPDELASDRHRDLLARFRAARAIDADPGALSGPAVAWVSGRWVPVWCRVDSGGRQLSLYKQRRSFLHILEINAPTVRAGGGGGEDSRETELTVHDHERRRDLRLRAAGVAANRGTGDVSDGVSVGGVRLLLRLAELLGACDDFGEADGVDCPDGDRPAAMESLQVPLRTVDADSGGDSASEQW